MRCALLLLLAGCSAGATQSATAPLPPDDIEWIVAVAQSDDGLVASPPIRRGDRREVGAQLPDAWGRGSTGWLLGFTAAQLDSLSLDGAPARAAAPHEPILPPPAWLASGAIVDGAATLEVSASAAPELYVPGLPACPPRFGHDTLVDVQCRSFPCRAVLERSGCRVRLEPTGCELGFEATLDGRGNLVFEDQQCTTLAARAGPAIALSCVDPPQSRCSLGLYEAEEPVEATIERVVLYDVDPQPFVREGFEQDGYVSSLAVLDDRVVVAGYGGAPFSAPCTDMPSALLFFSRETLEPMGTTPSVPCLRELVAAPDEETFFALFGGPAGARFGEFDRDGVLLREVEHVGAIRTEYGRIVVHSEGRFASFVELVYAQGADRVVTVDLQTFEITTFIDSNSRARPRDIVEVSNGRIAVTDREIERIFMVDVVANQLVGTPFDLSLCSTLAHPSLLFSARGQTYITADDNNAALTAFDLGDPNGTCATAKPFVESTDLRAPIGFVGDDLVIASRTYDLLDPTNPGTALLTFYRPSREAFLPSQVELGYGMPTAVALRDEKIYVLLPWAAQLVRVSLPGR